MYQQREKDHMIIYEKLQKHEKNMKNFKHFLMLKTLSKFSEQQGPCKKLILCLVGKYWMLSLKDRTRQGFLILPFYHFHALLHCSHSSKKKKRHKDQKRTSKTIIILRWQERTLRNSFLKEPTITFKWNIQVADIKDYIKLNCISIQQQQTIGKRKWYTKALNQSRRKEVLFYVGKKKNLYADLTPYKSN